MMKFIEKIKKYFLVSPYTQSELNEFAKVGDLPEEFLIKRRRVYVLVFIIGIIWSIIYIVFVK